MPYYFNINNDGLLEVNSLGDGYEIELKWATAYPTIRSNKIAYNIYMSSDIAPIFPETFFYQSPTFVSVDGSNSVVIKDLSAGEMYHFAVRAIEYDKTFFDLTTLPIAYNGLRTYPTSLLMSNIDATIATIPLIDASQFPSHGTIKLGAEQISYTAKSGNNLTSAQRGYNGSVSTIHNTDGYDGYSFWDPNAIFWPVIDEDQNTRVFENWNRFDVDHFPFNPIDGYHQKTTDDLNTDLSGDDAANVDFPPYDFAGYHRTDPVLLLNGTCVGSYLSGYMFCADSTTGVGQQIRGISVQDRNLQRQEVLLSTTGEPVILVKRRWTGITCKCMLPYNEHPEARCNLCFGGGIVISYEQYFNPRRSDGRIMVRFDPAVDSVKATDSGLESDMQPTCWGLSVPTCHNRDFLVRFEDDQQTPEFYYEILNVTRNKLFLDQMGAQKFAAQRIRKTDIIYSIPITYDTSTIPRIIHTTISSSPGIAPHSHTIVVSEKITNINQINQITSVDAGHSHAVRGGLVSSGANLPSSAPGIGHSHQIIFP